MIQKGYILEILNDGLEAKVETLQGEVLNNVLLLHPYGSSSNPNIDNSSLILLFFSLGSKTNAFGIPYNPPLQSTLESGEKEVGNLSVGNKITFKANGDIEVLATNDLIENAINKTITATGDITATADNSMTLSASTVDIGDAVDLVLNQSASMQVVIPGGSSAGTYPVTILTAGQTKVNA
jgi:hypothetical protein